MSSTTSEDCFFFVGTLKTSLRGRRRVEGRLRWIVRTSTDPACKLDFSFHQNRCDSRCICRQRSCGGCQPLLDSPPVLSAVLQTTTGLQPRDAPPCFTLNSTWAVPECTWRPVPTEAAASRQGADGRVTSAIWPIAF